MLLPLVVALLRRMARGDCGAAGLLIYNVLGDQPQSAREIQDRTLLPQQTVSRKLRQLLDRGLAEKSADGWARGAAEPKDAASSKVKGHCERDTVRAERERAAYQNNKLRKPQAARRKELRQRKAEVRRILRKDRLPNYGYLGLYPLDEHRLADGVTGEVIEVPSLTERAVA